MKMWGGGGGQDEGRGRQLDWEGGFLHHTVLTMFLQRATAERA